jgi:hypothetical protein
MSGHRRVCVTAILILAGLSISPASSNPLTDLFNPAPKETTAPAPAAAPEECASQPGRSTARGQHWVYQRDGHRKCWFEADATVSVKRQADHHAVRHHAGAVEDNEALLRKKTVMDARDQLPSPAPAAASQSAAPPSEPVDPAAVPDDDATTPAVPIPAEPASDRLTSDHATPRAVDVDMLLADSSLDKEPTTSTLPAATGAPSIPDAGEDGWGSIAPRTGVVLIALGLVLLLGSLLVRRYLDRGATPIRRM